jgi:acetoin utilization deacetylase AcuC-like enzyme
MRLPPSRRDVLLWPGAGLLLTKGTESVAATKFTTALLADPIYREHDPGAGHPERPERYDAVTQALQRGGLLKSLLRIEPRVATEDEIALCHDHRYIQIVRREIAAGAHELSTGDTNVGPRSWDVALKAVGGVLNAIDTVVGQKTANAFCVVRPPGHHARPQQGMGFCIFNNIAIAARYAQRKHGIGKVLIADWDVHHGNGTQDTFYADGSVFFFSTHQSPWYPGTGPANETGEGNGKGCTMNFPFPAGSGQREIVGAFRENLRRAADDFKPDLVMISAGFDSRLNDPLGQFTLSDQDFEELTGVMLEVAGTHAGGRLVSVLEGGYSLSGLASAAAAHVSTLVKGSSKP